MLVCRFQIYQNVSPEWRSQKQAFQENKDSDRLKKDFELKIWSANLTCSGSKLPKLQMIITIFDRFMAFFSD